jgi:hypothetical protein
VLVLTYNRTLRGYIDALAEGRSPQGPSGPAIALDHRHALAEVGGQSGGLLPWGPEPTTIKSYVSMAHLLRF